MEKEKLIIGKTLAVGVLIFVFLVVLGGVAYLMGNGSHYVNYRLFHQPVEMFSSIRGVLIGLSMDPLAWVQLGLLILILLQLVRVVLTTWLFARIKDRIFVVISLFILCVLVYALF